MVQNRKTQRSMSTTKSDTLRKMPLLTEPGPLAHPVYTTAQVAAALRLSTRTILRAIVSGQLQARKVGKLYLIAQDAVQRFWESLPLATEAPKTVGRPKKHRSSRGQRTSVSLHARGRTLQERCQRPPDVPAPEVRAGRANCGVQRGEGANSSPKLRGWAALSQTS